MKKTVSIILIVGLILSLTSVAFAADETSGHAKASYIYHHQITISEVNVMGKKGIGTLLMKEVLKYIKSNNFATVSLFYDIKKKSHSSY